jgi:transposase
METTASKDKRSYQRHPIPFKREVVEASFKSGVSVARLALQYGLNANQIWTWRRLYREGRLCEGNRAALVAVDVIDTPRAVATRTVTREGCLEIAIGRAQLCVTGRVDAEVLKTAIAALLS